MIENFNNKFLRLLLYMVYIDKKKLEGMTNDFLGLNNHMILVLLKLHKYFNEKHFYFNIQKCLIFCFSNMYLYESVTFYIITSTLLLKTPIK